MAISLLPSMTLLQAILIAVLQGATELFPVSSLGHAVILPSLLGWHIDQKAPEFLPFLVVLHLGTAAALLLYFWRDWFGFARAIWGRGQNVRSERRTFGLVCVATLPAVVIGFALEHILRGFFGSPVLAAAFLIVNGGILYLGERIKHAGTKSIDEVDWKAALAIGACQALALIPGISRSGATMVGGVLAGLTHKDAARFSFLLATPIIAGAGVLEVPKLIHQGGGFSRTALCNSRRHHRRCDGLCEHRFPDALFQKTRNRGARSLRLVLLGARRRGAYRPILAWPRAAPVSPACGSRADRYCRDGLLVAVPGAPVTRSGASRRRNMTSKPANYRARDRQGRRLEHITLSTDRLAISASLSACPTRCRRENCRLSSCWAASAPARIIFAISRMPAIT